MKKKLWSYIIFYILAVLLVGCSDKTEPDAASGEGSAYWEKIKELYDKAKASGEKVPDNVTEWAKTDIQKIGDWEYKVVRWAPGDEAELEKTLNALGDQRWECFWVREEASVVVLMFKRPVRSYLQVIPVKELFRFIPQGAGQ